MPDSVQYNTYAEKMITVIIAVDSAGQGIVMIIVNGMFQSNVINGSLHHMSAIPVIRRKYAGKINIFTQHSMLMRR